MFDRIIEFVCVAVAALVIAGTTVALVTAVAMTAQPVTGGAVIYDSNLVLDALSVPNYAIVMLFGLTCMAAGLMRTKARARSRTRR